MQLNSQIVGGSTHGAKTVLQFKIGTKRLIEQAGVSLPSTTPRYLLIMLQAGKVWEYTYTHCSLISELDSQTCCAFDILTSWLCINPLMGIAADYYWTTASWNWWWKTVSKVGGTQKTVKQKEILVYRKILSCESRHLNDAEGTFIRFVSLGVFRLNIAHPFHCWL